MAKGKISENGYLSLIRTSGKGPRLPLQTRLKRYLEAHKITHQVTRNADNRIEISVSVSADEFQRHVLGHDRENALSEVVFTCYARYPWQKNNLTTRILERFTGKFKSLTPFEEALYTFVDPEKLTLRFWFRNGEIGITPFPPLVTWIMQECSPIRWGKPTVLKQNKKGIIYAYPDYNVLERKEHRVYRSLVWVVPRKEAVAVAITDYEKAYSLVDAVYYLVKEGSEVPESHGFSRFNNGKEEVSREEILSYSPPIRGFYRNGESLPQQLSPHIVEKMASKQGEIIRPVQVDPRTGEKISREMVDVFEQINIVERYNRIVRLTAAREMIEELDMIFGLTRELLESFMIR